MTKPRTVPGRVAHGLATVAITVFASVGVLLLAVALFARTDDTGVTHVAGHPVMTVLSDSMTPTFRAGDLIVEDPVTSKAAQLGVGDVITFRAGDSGELVTHRIVRVRGSAADGSIRYRTQGDANNALDITPVTPEQVVGVYLWRIPYAGYVIDATRSQTGMSLLIFIPGALLLFPLLVRWWRAAGESAAMESPAQTPESPELVPGGARRGAGG